MSEAAGKLDEKVEWRIHANRDALNSAVVEDVSKVIADALAARDQALIALAGGQTPWAIYKRLASLPLGWGDVTVIPSDERLVPLDDPLSNLAALKTALGETGASIRPLDQVADLPFWPPDLVWLGMGNDGHTASIFPGPDLELALQSAERSAVVHPDPLPPEAPVDRLTLTRSAIHAAREIRLVLTGEEKRAIALDALADGADSSYPLGRVLAGSETPTIVHWCP